MKTLGLLAMVLFVAVGAHKVAKKREEFIAAINEAIAEEERAGSGSRYLDAEASLILPSAIGEVTLTSELKQEYEAQNVASIKYGARPDRFELALGLLPPCCGTCWQGYRRGYCTFWWTGCGWGTPLYYSKGCCGNYCLCCYYGRTFGGPHYAVDLLQAVQSGDVSNVVGSLQAAAQTSGIASARDSLQADQSGDVSNEANLAQEVEGAAAA